MPTKRKVKEVQRLFVAAPDEQERWPKSALCGDALDAFDSLRVVIRRAQLCRSILTESHTLPTGLSGWENTRPTLDDPRRCVERARPSLIIGLRGPLKQKERYALTGWESYHDRAIREAEPLVNALGAISSEGWAKLGRDRAWSLPEIDDDDATHRLAEMYMEATAASKLLKLPPHDQRIVLDGSYACRRIDELSMSAEADAHEERAEHMRTVMKLCNDLGQYDLGEKIQAMIDNQVSGTTFAQSAPFDRFKGHLIEAIARITLAPTVTPAVPAPATTTQTPPAAPSHTENFESVTWRGETHHFNKAQATAVKLLWEAWEKGGLSVRQSAVGSAIGSSDENYRLVYTFRNKNNEMHDAWGQMIFSAPTPGSFMLSETESPKNHESRHRTRTATGIKPHRAKRKGRKSS